MEVAEFQTMKREALTRRANKLIGWLQRPEYTFVGEASVTHLIKVIDLIKWALENSIPAEDWRHFRRRFNKAINKAVELVETPEQQKNNYSTSIEMVVTTLRSYLEYIEINV